MLSLSTSNRVTFNVNVSGTANTPTVRAVVGERPSHSYKASQLKDGTWEVVIDLPKSMEPGTVPFKVEVLLNGRLFTPINTTTEVTAPAEEPKKAPEKKVEPEKKTDKQKEEPKPPKKKDEPKAAKKLLADLEGSKKPEVLKAPDPVTPFREAARLSGLEALAKAPVQKRPKPIEQTVEVKRVKISMAEIASAAEKLEPIRFEQPRVVETQRSTSSEPPVSLIKGEIIYR